MTSWFGAWMRSPLDLLELPYSFSQLELLLSEEFRREASDRGVELTEEELEVLHRARILVPMFRVTRDSQPTRRALASDVVRGGQLASWVAPTLDVLKALRSSGGVHDPAVERLVPRSRRVHRVRLPGFEKPVYETYQTSVYVYSQHQLSLLPVIRLAIASIDRRPRDAHEPLFVQADRRWIAGWRKTGGEFRAMAIAGSALEPLYFSRVVNVITLRGTGDIKDLIAWRQDVPVNYMLDWLKLDAKWLEDSASRLLIEAERIDPLRDWSELVARADPQQWQSLRGAARAAIDLRMLAETFLAYHDDLVDAKKATTLEDPGPRARGQFDGRLKRKRPLDEILTEFGLSPHPRLVLVVEGKTELLLVPRAMEILGINTDEDFISVQDAEGVDKDLKPLFAVLAPRVIPEPEYNNDLRAIRPVTRFLVVFDPEGQVSTPKARDKRRKIWVERIQRAMPGADSDLVMRKQLDSLVQLTTWNERNESFEFAHFTDRQIATALLRVPGYRKPQKLEDMTRRVTKCRTDRGNLERLLPKSASKGRLARELLPIFEQKLRRAQARKTEHKIPVTTVLDRAVSLGLQFPRGTVLIRRGP